MVKSDDPEAHSNSVEVTEGDMTKVFLIFIPVQCYDTFYTLGFFTNRRVKLKAW